MDRGNFFRRAVTMLFAVAIMTFAALAHAEIYTGEGSYVMSEGENLGVAKERAKADAMRNACEKAGVYVKSYSRARDLELEEDVIETMTANILKLVEEPYFYPLETVDNLEGVLIRVTVKAQIDDSDITRWLNKDDSEKAILVAQMEAMRKENEEQARQIADLRRQISQATTKEEKTRITKEFADKDKIFLSNQKVDRAWRYYDKGDYESAIKFHDEALKLNPNNAGAYYGRGTAYNGLKQYEQAIQDFDKAVQLNPKNDLAYNNRGNAYNDGLKQHERAIKDFDKAIQLNPKNSVPYYNRGLAYHRLEQYERAIKDYDKAIQLNPNFDYAYNNRGNAYDDLRQYERAIKDYDKAIQLNPNFDYAYNDRGTAYYGLKQYERAIKDYDKAIQLNPNFDYAYNNRGLAYSRLEQYERAIKDYDKAIQLNPNYVDAYNNRGRAYYCLKNYQRALKDFDKALEINPSHELAKNNRESCLKAMGK